MNYTATELEAAVAAGRVEATAAERGRMTAILTGPLAKGKEKQATTLALAGISADQAAAILGAAQPDAAPMPNIPIGERAATAPGGLVVDAVGGSPPVKAAAGWDRAIARANALVDEKVAR